MNNKISVTKIGLHHHDQANRSDNSSMASDSISRKYVKNYWNLCQGK